MDPLTHALSGAVAVRAILPKSLDLRVSRTARWTLILGSIFPDIDVLAKPFDPDGFATIRIHRSVTHSLVCLPAWACLFALLAAWFCRRRGIAAPGRLALGVLFGAGIGLHILFDCITSFGTMVWSPLSWTRVEWDWTFIVDLSLTGILLFFLLLSWIAEPGPRGVARAAWMLVLMSLLLAALAVGSYGLERPLPVATAVCVFLLAGLPLAISLFGGRIPMTARSWCIVGVLAAAAYLGADELAHARAIERVREYATEARLENAQIAALPLPPNLLLWQGFARTPASVHEWRFSLTDPPGTVLSTSAIPASGGEACPPSLWKISQVQAWLRFARFPVVVCSHVPQGETAEFTDLRFERPMLRADGSATRGRPAPFTWRVTFSADGRLISEGFVIH